MGSEEGEKVGAGRPSADGGWRLRSRESFEAGSLEDSITNFDYDCVI